MPMATINVHARIVSDPVRFTVDQMFQAAVRLFSTFGLNLSLQSIDRLQRPEFRTLDLGEQCVFREVSPSQAELYANRNGVPDGEIVAYFVETLVPPCFGCAGHLRGAPAFVIDSYASLWTVAHELAHVLGLEYHVTEAQRLMTESTERITTNLPQVTQQEIDLMLGSDFVQA